MPEVCQHTASTPQSANVHCRTLVFRSVKNRYTRSFSLDVWSKKVYNGRNRLFHQVDGSRTSGPNHRMQNERLHPEIHHLQIWIATYYHHRQRTIIR